MITLDLLGQTGNHLFQYSFLRIVGEYHKYDYRIFTNPNILDKSHKGSWYSDDIISCDIKNIDIFQQSFLYDDINNECGYNNNIFKINRIDNIKDNTTIRGIFQSKDVINNIDKKWFTVKSGVCNYNVNNTCFIHVRGTDSLLNPKTNIPDIKLFYEEAKNTIENINGKKMNYVVITDDVLFAKKMVVADEYLYGTRLHDFYNLYNAKYLIIPISSFSWWAAFLSKNSEICIAPSGWCFYKYKKMIKSDWCYTEKFIWI